MLIRILQIQFALFYVDYEARPDRLISKLNFAMDDVFDQMPIILPIPQEAPPEIPSVIMKSSDGVYNCNIARSRIDLIIKSTNSTDHTSDFLDNFINKIQSFCAVVFGNNDIQRFGLVGQYFFQVDDPVKRIQTVYLKNNLGGLEELSIRYNKKFKDNGLTINDVVEISMAKSTELDGKEQKGVFIQRDINNVANGKSLQIEDVVMTTKNLKSRFELTGVLGLIK